LPVNFLEDSMRHVIVGVCLVIGGAACAPAPPPAPEPPPPSSAITASVKVPFDITKDNISKALEQVPENRLSFRATPAVRTFGQIFGHVADSNYMLCALASGEQAPEGSAEASAKTKADLQKAVADSFAFCDRAFAGLNDQTGAEPATVPFLPMPNTRLGVLAFVAAHDWEHYGNIVTYLRLNKMVPPSTQQAQQASGM
jgi:uncharacterized damage-inducible protein DinB